MLKFGMMFQGSSFDIEGKPTRRPDGTLNAYFPIAVDVQRLWDTDGTMSGMGAGPIFNLDGLTSQVRLAERNGSQVVFCFGFGAHWTVDPDPKYKPPASALLPGSKNRPTPEYLAAVAEAVMTFSVGKNNDQPRRLHFIQGWNEPAEGWAYWDVGTPEDNHEQSIGLARYCKSRDSGVSILSPSFNALDQPYGLAFMQRYVDSMRARGNGCDAISFHLYTDRKLPHAEQIKQVHTTLDNLIRVCRDRGLKYFCTEFDGPWDAYQIMHDREIELLTLNGQRPPAPYEREDLANLWNLMRVQVVSKPPAPPVPVPTPKKKGGIGCPLTALLAVFFVVGITAIVALVGSALFLTSAVVAP